jgi:ubiquinone/menaquinone biosynthesis C-methylase UbiE
MSATENIASWEAVYQDVQPQRLYPSEDVVRFLVGTRQTGVETLLDIGCGAGRHLSVAADLGFNATGVDCSAAAVATAADDRWSVEVADMTDLPFEDESFDVAIAASVLYYGNLAQVEQAVQEMRRVLRPNGWGFLTTRTTSDWRCGSGSQLEGHTWQLHLPDQIDHGMVLTFLTAAEVVRVFEDFRVLNVELLEYTTMNRLRKSSDWLITVYK